MVASGLLVGVDYLKGTFLDVSVDGFHLRLSVSPVDDKGLRGFEDLVVGVGDLACHDFGQEDDGVVPPDERIGLGVPGVRIRGIHEEGDDGGRHNDGQHDAHPLADCCVHGITQFPAPLTERDPLVTLLLKSKTGSTIRVTETDAVAPVEAWVSVRVKE